jgi:hypothetical protein
VLHERIRTLVDLIGKKNFHLQYPRMLENCPVAMSTASR